jgi:protein TIF31
MFFCSLPRYLGIIAANNDRVLAADQTSDAIGQLNALQVRFFSSIPSASPSSLSMKLTSFPSRSLQVIVYQEMVFRAAKRILRSLVKGLLSDEHPAVVSHFLNCLVGADFEASPKPVHTPSPFISDSPSSWTELTPESLRAQIESEVASRYRYVLPAEYLVKGLKKKQIVRELALRFGFQLASREYQFEAPSSSSTSPEETPAAPTVNGSSEKKVAGGKKAKTAGRQGRSTTFQPEDVLALVPMIKDAEPSVRCHPVSPLGLSLSIFR